MSKHSAVAMLLVEAAKRSFSDTGIRTITNVAWTATCGDSSVQKYVSSNLNPSAGFFKKLSPISPSSSDFEALHDKLLPRINALSQLDELQAVFHGYAAETLLYGEICGVVSEPIEEIAADKLEAELAAIL